MNLSLIETKSEDLTWSFLLFSVPELVFFLLSEITRSVLKC